MDRPSFPSADDQVTLYYDASQGNGELTGVIPVYIHTGLITSGSSTPTDWQYVNMPWASTDPEWVMDYVGTNLWSYDFGGQTLADFYGLPANETAEQLAMVFRNGSGTAVGRDTDGGDLFLPLSDGSFSAVFLQPQSNNSLAVLGQTVPLQASASEPAALSFVSNGDTLATASDAVQLSHDFIPATPGTHVVEFHANNGSNSAVVTAEILVLPETPNVAAAPEGTQDGLNPSADGSSIVLQLFAPGKSHVFFIGDITNWDLQEAFMMNVTPGGDRFWIELSGLNPNQEYRYQYHVMPNDERFADPYAEKQLDYWNDPWIAESTYPFLIDFPTGMTNQGPVSVFQTGEDSFDWTDGDFDRPAQENLVIYELLVRDFSNERTFDFIIDTLDYSGCIEHHRFGIDARQRVQRQRQLGLQPFSFTSPWTKPMAQSQAARIGECLSRARHLGHPGHGHEPQRLAQSADPDVVAEQCARGRQPLLQHLPSPTASTSSLTTTTKPRPRRTFTKRVMDFWREEFHCRWIPLGPFARLHLEWHRRQLRPRPDQPVVRLRKPCVVPRPRFLHDPGALDRQQRGEGAQRPWAS